MPSPTDKPVMPLAEALRELHALRREEIVVTTMGSAREWPRLSRNPLDLHYVPSAMGEAPALGLGLALACPGREVWVLNGDGCMAMNLGALITIRASGARNFTLFVLDNGVYEVTGGQQTAAAQAKADFCGFARAAGFENVVRFDRAASLRAELPAALTRPGPRCVVLDVAPVRDDFHLAAPGPIGPRLETFRAAL